MHGVSCVPVILCPGNFTSKVILSSTRKQFTWRDLEMRHNVNLTYNITTNSFQFCFYDVTVSFVFLEYCEVGRNLTCTSDSTFCCNNWNEFVARTHVKVTGDSSELFKSCLCPIMAMFNDHHNLQTDRQDLWLCTT